MQNFRFSRRFPDRKASPPANITYHSELFRPLLQHVDERDPLCRVEISGRPVQPHSGQALPVYTDSVRHQILADHDDTPFLRTCQAQIFICRLKNDRFRFLLAHGFGDDPASNCKWLKRDPSSAVNQLQMILTCLEISFGIASSNSGQVMNCSGVSSSRTNSILG